MLLCGITDHDHYVGIHWTHAMNPESSKFQNIALTKIIQQIIFYPHSTSVMPNDISSL
jgi:hypothetical protein